MSGPCLGFCGTKPNTLGAAAPRHFHSVGCSGDNRVSFRLCQGFLPRNLVGSRPRTRVQLPGIEHRALPAAVQGWHQRDRASRSPRGRPGGTFRSGHGLFASASRTPWESCAFHTVSVASRSHVRWHGSGLAFPAPVPSFGWAGCGLEKATGLAEAAAPIIRKRKEVGQA